jgi:hypothetical protein
VLYQYQRGEQRALGSRACADALCWAPVTRPAGLVQGRTFLSANSADAVKEFPSRYGVATDLPVESADSAVIAGNWTELLGGSIRLSLQAPERLLVKRLGLIWHRLPKPNPHHQLWWLDKCRRVDLLGGKSAVEGFTFDTVRQ